MNDTPPDPIASRHHVTNYLGCGGSLFANDGSVPSGNAWEYPGVFMLGRDIGLGTITDGTSNTIMFGEVTGKANNACYAWTCSQQVTHWNGANTAGNPYPDFNGAWFTFQSNHQGQLINWSFSDGSTHSISEFLDWRTLRALSGRSDGYPLPTTY